MYAYIKLGGHQHRVEKDFILLSEKTGHAEGTEFVCTDVLLVADEKGENVKLGKPLVAGAKVKLKVLSDTRAPKIVGFKYKKRKGYRKHWGHRQDLQKLQVLAVEA